MDFLALGTRLLQPERGRGQHSKTFYVGESSVGFVQDIPRTMESNDENDVITSSSLPMTERSGDSTPSSNDNNQGSSSSPLLSYQNRNMIVISLLIILIVLLLTTLIYLIYPPITAWYRRRRNGPQSEEDEKAHTLKRYETIEGWLISKRVMAHDKECESIQRKFCLSCKYGEEVTSPRSVEPFSPKSVDMAATASFDSAESGNTAPSYFDGEDDDEEEKECPICMESFEVGDIVSWSPNTEVACRHVFHHECIKEWMLQSGNCPCCREIILNIDAEGFQLERPVLKDLCIKRARYAATSYYCQTDGLVCFDKRPGKCSKDMLNSLKAVTACQITPQDLVDRRGHRNGSAESDSKSMEEAPADCENPPSTSSDTDNSENDSTILPLMGSNDDAAVGSTDYGSARLLDEASVDCEAPPPPAAASTSESAPILAEEIFSPSKLRKNATDRHRHAEVTESTV